MQVPIIKTQNLMLALLTLTLRVTSSESFPWKDVHRNLESLSLTPWGSTTVWQETCQRSWKQAGWGSHIHNLLPDSISWHCHSEIPVACREAFPEWQSGCQSHSQATQFADWQVLMQQIGSEFLKWGQKVLILHTMWSLRVRVTGSSHYCSGVWETHWERSWQNQNLCLKLNQCSISLL